MVDFFLFSLAVDEMCTAHDIQSCASCMRDLVQIAHWSRIRKLLNDPGARGVDSFVDFDSFGIFEPHWIR